MFLISQDSTKMTEYTEYIEFFISEYTEMKVAYVKQMTSPSSMHETGHSKLVPWDNPEGWDGEKGEGGILDRGHMYTHG